MADNIIDDFGLENPGDVTWTTGQENNSMDFA